jgi:hypothetical protein
MTEPHQRTRAILKTIKFLESLADPGLALGVPGMTPDVPDGVRFVASELLKDYPTQDEIELIHHALPELFDSVIQRQAEGMPASAMEGSLQETEEHQGVTVRALRDLLAKMDQDAVVVLRYDYKDPDGSSTCEGLALGQVQAVDVRALKSKDSWYDPLAGVQLYRVCETGDPELPDAVNGVLIG